LGSTPAASARNAFPVPTHIPVARLGSQSTPACSPPRSVMPAGTARRPVQAEFSPGGPAAPSNGNCRSWPCPVCYLFPRTHTTSLIFGPEIPDTFSLKLLHQSPKRRWRPEKSTGPSPVLHGNIESSAWGVGIPFESTAAPPGVEIRPRPQTPTVIRYSWTSEGWQSDSTFYEHSELPEKLWPPGARDRYAVLLHFGHLVINTPICPPSNGSGGGLWSRFGPTWKSCNTKTTP